jgi:hypothetical protein
MFYNASSFANHNLSSWTWAPGSSVSHQDFFTGAGAGNTEPNWP